MYMLENNVFVFFLIQEEFGGTFSLAQGKKNPGNTNDLTVLL